MTITNNVAAKLAVAFVATAMLVTLAFAPVANAQSTDADLQAQITALLAQIAALQAQVGGSSSGATSGFTYTRDLTVGSTGEDVKQLQMYLNSAGYAVASSGPGSAGAESTYFGPLTQAVLARYQASKGISPASGYFGPITRAQVNASASAGTTGGTSGLPAGCTSTSGFSPTTGVKCDSAPSGDDDADDDMADDTDDGDDSGPLSGGPGSIDTYELISAYNNEEVGEGQDDVIAVGLEIENSDSSDIDLTAVRVVFDEGTAATSRFNQYASEVSVWLGGEEVGRVDSDVFTRNNSWTKTITLDGARVDSDETVELTVAVSGVSNLDTNDAGDTWTVDLTSVRFKDGEGSTISEDPGTGLTTFSFESFATANDTELKITEGGTAAEAINDAHIINAHATDTTDNVPILAFSIEVEGDSDVNIDSLPVTLTSVEATGDDPDDLITTLYLYADGERIGSESLLTTDANGSTEVVVFDNLNYDLEAASTVKFEVRAKTRAFSADLDVGDTIQATFGETETDLATFIAEDETGENLADADKTGTITGGTNEIRDVILIVTLVGTPTAVRTAGDGANPVDSRSDVGTFTITFDVTAVDGNIFIDETAPAEGAGTDETDLNIDGVAAFTNSITSIAGGANGLAEDVTNSFRVDQDQTNRFQIVVDIRDSAATDMVSGFFDVSIVSILYALTDVDGNLLYTSDVDRFQTPAINLDDNE